MSPITFIVQTAVSAHAVATDSVLLGTVQAYIRQHASVTACCTLSASYIQFTGAWGEANELWVAQVRHAQWERIVREARSPRKGARGVMPLYGRTIATILFHHTKARSQHVLAQTACAH